MEAYEPTKEEIEKWRQENPRASFSMMDRQVAEWLKREKPASTRNDLKRGEQNKQDEQDKQDKQDKQEKQGKPKADKGAGDRAGRKIALLEGFKIPTRSKRGPLWTKSPGNPHATVNPDTEFLLPEEELTPPEQAVKMLEEMYPGLDTKNWEQALRIGIAPAMRACRSLEIDEERIIVFPWIKRPALARLAGLAEGTHYGELVERAIFPQLEKLYKQRKIGFQNYRAGEMSSDDYLQMEERTAEWLKEREEEIEGDICFSGAIMDMFQGYSVDAVRYETEKEKRIINGTSYVVQQILLTQTQLKAKREELHWDMPGDRYDEKGKSQFSSSLYCGVLGLEFRFYNDTTDDADTRCGSVVFLSDPSTSSG